MRGCSSPTGWLPAPTAEDRSRLEAAVTALRASEIDVRPAARLLRRRTRRRSRSRGSGHPDRRGRPALRQQLAALPHDHAGRLVTQLLTQGRYETARLGDHRRGRHIASRSCRCCWPPRRPPRGDAASCSAPRPLTPTIALVRGITDILDDGSVADGDVGRLIDEVAAIRHAIDASGEPYRWWGEPPTADPSHLGADPSPVGAEPSPVGAELPSYVDDGGDVLRGPGEAQRSAYPRLHVETGTERPDVVVVDQAFEVSVGLQQRRDSGLVSSSPIPFVSGEVVDLELVLLYDPASIEVTGSPRGAMTVSDADPYPSLTFQCVARWVDRVGHRRLGLQLLRDGQVVGVAWRTAHRRRQPRRGDPAPTRRPTARSSCSTSTRSARRRATRPDRLGLSRRRRLTHVRLDGVCRRPDRRGPRSAQHDHARGRRGGVRAGDAAVDPVLDRPRKGLSGPRRASVRIGRAVPEGIQAAVRQVVGGAGTHRGTGDPAAHRGVERPLGAGVLRQATRPTVGAAHRRSWGHTPRCRDGR